MSFLRTLTGLWRSAEETCERSADPALRTRYYKERQDQVLEAVLRALERLPGWQVVHVDRERGEVMAERRGRLGTSDLVVTVYRVAPVRSAVDVVCAKRGPLGDLGASYRTIVRLFDILHRELRPEA